MTPIIDVGLIGFGLSGRTFHARVLRSVPGLRLAAILQRQGAEAQTICPGVRVVHSLDELLSMEQISLIIVATPNDTHFELARRCLEAGRNVVVDKPFTTTWQEAAELVRLAKKSGRLITVYQNRRWDGDFLTVQNLLGSCKLGRLVLYEAHFDRYRPQLRPEAWRERAGPGSGILFDLGPHLVDQALLLFGPPRTIAADVRMEREGLVTDDAFDIFLSYPGMRAVLRSTMLACTPGPRFVLNGTRGSYIKHGLDPQEEALKRGETPGGEGWGMEPEAAWGTFAAAEDNRVSVRSIPTEAGDYRRFYQNVCDAISGRAELAVTPEQALHVMRVLELAKESSQKRCPVPWRPE